MKTIFIEAELIYNVVLIAAIQPSDSVLHVKVKVKSLSHVRPFATPWTAAYQAPPSMGFSRQEYWSGMPFPSPGDLPNPGIEPGSPALQGASLPLSHLESPSRWWLSGTHNTVNGLSIF